MKQTVTWTVCPNGVSGSNLRLSVFVSPRLQPDGGGRPTLSQFPDFVDWPERIAAAQFQVRFGNGAPIPATRVQPPGAEAGPDLWRAVVDGTTYVKSHDVPDLSRRAFCSFPVRNVLTHLKLTYQATAAESPTVVPKITAADLKAEAVGRFLKDIAPAPEERAQITRQVDARLRAAPVKALFNPAAADDTSLTLRSAAAPPAGATTPGQAVSQTAYDFNQLRTFYEPKGADLRVQAVRKPVEVPEIDFHGIVSSLGQYPEVLRLVGLVIDLEVPLSAAPQGATTVSVMPAWTPKSQTTDATPRTRCRIGADSFVAQPRPDSDIADGMLKLNDESRFEVGQVDVDGAAIKAVNLAEDIQTADDEEEKDAALPSLRSAGLWVARANRAHSLAAVVMPRLQLQTLALRKLEGGGADEVDDLYADDITRGYRVDILDQEAGSWRSLCRRLGKYHFAKASGGTDQTLTIQDEGWVSSAMTESLQDDDDDLHVHESIFAWDGWSLSAPRPLRPVPQEGVPEDPGQEYGLDVQFAAAPGSLPRLRFGHSYRLRARAVDLAGNSLPPDLDDASAATDGVDYCRQEPVSSPVLVPRKSFDDSPGETLENMVVRSFNDTPAKDAEVSPEWSDRHVAPPKTSQLMAERHGKFDAPEGMMGDAETYRMIVQKDGTFGPAYDTDQLELPYLPDPLAAGASIRSTTVDVDPGPGDSVFKVPFDGDWPDALPFRIRIVELGRGDANPEPEWHPNRRVLTIPLGKAEIAEIWVSCYMDEAQVPNMGVWQWSVDGVAAPAIRKAALQPQELKAVRRQLYRPGGIAPASQRVSFEPAQAQKLQVLHTAVLKGLHWMVTPYRKITLVHAVQQPLVTPDIRNLQALKSIGNTFATLRDRFPISGKSTIKVDIVAEWEEPVDPLAEPAWRTIKGSTHVVELPVTYGQEELRMGPGESDADAQGIQEADPQSLRLGPGRGVRLQRRAIQPRPAAVGRAVGMRLPRRLLRVLGPRHEFGDTKYRQVTYKAVATTRFREYFPFSDDDIKSGRASITRESEQVKVKVLSSARPAAPTVRYVIPTFGWEKQKQPDGFSSKRSGGGLRVYMERPWFSSGDGELLGVVLPSQAPTVAARGLRLVRAASQSVVPEALRPFVTQSGADPIWRSGSVKYSPAPEDFRRSVATEDGLTLDELPGARVAVVGHEVQFDVGRQLWFCDIEIDPQSAYYPFVRLALARYQPNSVKTDAEDCKLSRVVLADFAQLTPDRMAAMSLDAATRRVAVSVRGLTYQAPGQGSEMEVALETRQPGVPGQFGWVPVPDGTVALAASRITDRETLWSGEVTLPGAEPPDRFRLVVKEYERFAVDQDTRPAGGRPTLMVMAPTDRRLVYADVLRFS